MTETTALTMYSPTLPWLAWELLQNPGSSDHWVRMLLGPDNTVMVITGSRRSDGSLAIRPWSSRYKRVADAKRKAREQLDGFLCLGYVPSGTSRELPLSANQVEALLGWDGDTVLPILEDIFAHRYLNGSEAS